MLNQIAFGKRVHDRRKAQRLTQEQLGDALGVSAQAVSKWELGESAPDVGLLPDLCKALGVSADGLLGVEPAIGLESLSEALAERLPQERGRSYEEALLRVLGRLHFVEQVRSATGVRDDGNSGGRMDASGLRVAYRLQAGRVMSVDLFEPKGLAVLILDEAMQATPEAAKLDAIRVILSPLRWEVAQALLQGPQTEADLCKQLGESSPDAVREAIAALMQADLVLQDHAGYQLDTSGAAPTTVALLRVLSTLQPAVTGTTYQ